MIETDPVTWTRSRPLRVSEGVRAQAFVIWHLDAPLDEIDDLLEENAAEFVDSYVQRGGQ